jgi:hypothetical protein
MRPQPLTLIAPLASQEQASLKALEELMRERGRSIFESSPSTHFAAFVLLGDREGRKRLFLSADHDGTLDDYLEELWDADADAMDAIFSYCSGYDGRAGFHAFVTKRSYRSQAYFAAFQDETAAGIKAKAAGREQLEAALGDHPARIGKLIAALSSARDGRPWPERLAGTMSDFVSGVRWAIHFRFWAMVIKLAQAYGERIVTNRPRSAGADFGQTLDRALDIRYQAVQTGQIQNQMTNISWVRPRRGLLLKVALWVVNLLARFAFHPGDLAGVKSVHFARWTIIDGGRGLLFEGNFDGTWENYMAEFADRIAWGLDAVWGNTEGYPPAGMRDIWAFKRYIRDLQYPPAMVYMAYPELSVMNTIRDVGIADALASGRPREIARALGDL